MAFLPAVRPAAVSDSVQDLQPVGRRVRVAALNRQLRALTSFLRCRQNAQSVRLLFSPDDARLAEDLLDLVQSALYAGPDALLVPDDLAGAATPVPRHDAVPGTVQGAACMALSALLLVQVDKCRASEIPDDSNDMLPSMASVCRLVGLPLSRYAGVVTALHGLDVDTLQVSLGVPGTEGVPRDDCSVLVHWLQRAADFTYVRAADFDDVGGGGGGDRSLCPFAAEPDPVYYQPPRVDFGATVMRFVFEQLSATGFAGLRTERIPDYVAAVRANLPVTYNPGAHPGVQRVSWLLCTAALHGYLSALKMDSQIVADVADELRVTGALEDIAMRMAVETDAHVTGASLLVTEECGAVGGPSETRVVRVLPPVPEAQRIYLGCLFDVLFDTVQPMDTEDGNRMTAALQAGTPLLQPLEGRLAPRAHPVRGPGAAPLSPVPESLRDGHMDEETVQVGKGGSSPSSSPTAAHAFSTSFALGRALIPGLDSFAEHLATDSALTWAIKDILSYPAAFGGSLVTNVAALLADLVQNDPSGACSVSWDTGVSPLYLRLIMTSEAAYVPLQVMMSTIPEMLYTESVRERVAAYDAASHGAVAWPRPSPTLTASHLSGSGSNGVPPLDADVDMETSALEGGTTAVPPLSNGGEVSRRVVDSELVEALSAPAPFGVVPLATGAGADSLSAQAARASPTASNLSSVALPRPSPTAAAGGAAATASRGGRPFIPGHYEYNLAEGHKGHSAFKVVEIAKRVLGTALDSAYEADAPYKVLLSAVLHTCVRHLALLPPALPAAGRPRDLHFAALFTDGVHPYAPKLRFCASAGMPLPMYYNADVWTAGGVWEEGWVGSGPLPGPALRAWHVGAIQPHRIQSIRSCASAQSDLLCGSPTRVLAAVVAAVQEELGRGGGPSAVVQPTPTELHSLEGVLVDPHFSCPYWDTDVYSHSRFDRIMPTGTSTGSIDKKSAGEMAENCAEVVENVPGAVRALLEAIRQAYVGLAVALASCWDEYGRRVAVAASAPTSTGVEVALLDSLFHRQLLSMQHGLTTLAAFTRAFGRTPFRASGPDNAKCLRNLFAALVHGVIWSRACIDFVQDREATSLTPPPRVQRAVTEATECVQVGERMTSSSGKLAWKLLLGASHLPGLLDVLRSLLHAPRRVAIAACLAAASQVGPQERLGSLAARQRQVLLGMSPNDLPLLPPSLLPSQFVDTGGSSRVISSALTECWATTQELLSVLQRHDPGATVPLRSMHFLESVFDTAGLGEGALVTGVGRALSELDSADPALAVLAIHLSVTLPLETACAVPMDEASPGHCLSATHILAAALRFGRDVVADRSALVALCFSLLDDVATQGTGNRWMQSRQPYAAVAGEVHYSRLHGSFVWLCAWQSRVATSLFSVRPDGLRRATVVARAVAAELYEAHTRDVETGLREREGSAPVAHRICAQLWQHEIRCMASGFARLFTALADVLILLSPLLPTAAGITPLGPPNEFGPVLLSHLAPYADFASYGVAEALSAFAAPLGVSRPFDHTNGGDEYCAAVVTAQGGASHRIDTASVIAAAYSVDVCRLFSAVTSGGDSALHEYTVLRRAVDPLIHGAPPDLHAVQEAGHRLNTAVLYAAMRAGCMGAMLDAPMAYLNLATATRTGTDAALSLVVDRVVHRGGEVVAKFLTTLCTQHFIQSSGYSLALARAAARFHVALHHRYTGEDRAFATGKRGPAVHIAPQMEQAFSLDDFSAALAATVAMRVMPVLLKCTRGDAQSALHPVVARALLSVMFCTAAQLGLSSDSPKDGAVSALAIQLGCAVGPFASQVANVVIPGPVPFARASTFVAPASALPWDVLVASAAGLRSVLLLQAQVDRDPLTGAGDGLAPNVVVHSLDGRTDASICLGCVSVLDDRASTCLTCGGPVMLSTSVVRRSSRAEKLASSGAMNATSIPDLERMLGVRPPASRPQHPGPTDEAAIADLVGMGFSRGLAVRALRRSGGLGASEDRRVRAVESAADYILNDAHMEEDSVDGDHEQGSGSSATLDAAVAESVLSARAASMAASFPALVRTMRDALNDAVSSLNRAQSRPSGGTRGVVPPALCAAWGVSQARTPWRPPTAWEDATPAAVDRRALAVALLHRQLPGVLAAVSTVCARDVLSRPLRLPGTASIEDSWIAMHTGAFTADLAVALMKTLFVCSQRGFHAPLHSVLAALSAKCDAVLSCLQAGQSAEDAVSELQLMLAHVSQPINGVALHMPAAFEVRGVLLSTIDRLHALLASPLVTPALALRLADAVALAGTVLTEMQCGDGAKLFATSKDMSAILTALPAHGEGEDGPMHTLTASLAAGHFALIPQALAWTAVAAKAIQAASSLDSAGVLQCLSAATRLLSAFKHLSAVRQPGSTPGSPPGTSPVRTLLQALLELLTRSPAKTRQSVSVDATHALQEAIQLALADCVADVPASLWLTVRRFQHRFLQLAVEHKQVEADATRKSGHTALATLSVHDVLVDATSKHLWQPLDLVAFAACCQAAPRFRWAGALPSVELLSDPAMMQALPRVTQGALSPAVRVPKALQFDAHRKASPDWLTRMGSKVTEAKGGHVPVPTPREARRAVPVGISADTAVLKRIHTSADGLVQAMSGLALCDPSARTSLLKLVQTDVGDSDLRSAQLVGVETALAVVHPSLTDGLDSARLSQKLLAGALETSLLPQPGPEHASLSAELACAVVSAFSLQARARPAEPAGQWMDGTAVTTLLQAIQQAVEAEPRMATALLRLPASTHAQMQLASAAVADGSTAFHWTRAREQHHMTGLEVLSCADTLSSPFLDWLLLNVVPGLVFTDSSAGAASLLPAGKDRTSKTYTSVFDDTVADADPAAAGDHLLAPTSPLVCLPQRADVAWRRELGSSASAALGLIQTLVACCPPSSVIVDTVIRRLMSAMVLASSSAPTSPVFGCEGRRMAALCSYAATLRNALLPSMVGKVVNMLKKDGKQLAPSDEREDAYVARSGALVRLHLHCTASVLAHAQLSIDLSSGQSAATTSRVMAVLHSCITSDVTQELGRLAGEWSELTLRHAVAVKNVVRSSVLIAAAFRELAIALSITGSPRWDEAVTQALTARRLSTSSDAAQEAAVPASSASNDLWRTIVGQAHSQFDVIAAKAAADAQAQAKLVADVPQKSVKSTTEALRSLKHWRATALIARGDKPVADAWIHHLVAVITKTTLKADAAALTKTCVKLKDLLLTGRHPLSVSLGASETSFVQVQHLLRPMGLLFAHVRASAVLMAGFESSDTGRASCMSAARSVLYPTASRAVGQVPSGRTGDAAPATGSGGAGGGGQPPAPTSTRKRLRGSSFAGDTGVPNPAPIPSDALSSPGRRAVVFSSSASLAGALMSSVGTPSAGRRVRARSGSYGGGGVAEYGDRADDEEQDGEEVEMDAGDAGGAIARFIMDATSRGNDQSSVEIHLNVGEGQHASLPSILGDVLQHVSAASRGIMVTAEVNSDHGESAEEGDEEGGEGDEDEEMVFEVESGSDEEHGHGEDDGQGDDHMDSDEDAGDGDEDDEQNNTGSEDEDVLGVGHGLQGGEWGHDGSEDMNGGDQTLGDGELEGEADGMEGVGEMDLTGHVLGGFLQSPHASSGNERSDDEGDVFDEEEQEMSDSEDDAQGSSHAARGTDAQRASRVRPRPSPASAVGFNNWWADMTSPDEEDAEQHQEDGGVGPGGGDDAASVAMSHATQLGRPRLPAGGAPRRIGHSARQLDTDGGSSVGPGALPDQAAAELRRVMRGIRPERRVPRANGGGVAEPDEDAGEDHVESSTSDGTHVSIRRRLPNISATRTLGPFTVVSAPELSGQSLLPPVDAARVAVEAFEPSPELEAGMEQTTKASGEAHLPLWSPHVADLFSALLSSTSSSYEDVWYPIASWPLLPELAQRPARRLTMAQPFARVSVDRVALQFTEHFGKFVQDVHSLQALLLCAFATERSPNFPTGPSSAIVRDQTVLPFVASMPSSALVSVVQARKEGRARGGVLRDRCLMPLSASFAPELSFAVLMYGSDEDALAELLKETRHAMVQTGVDQWRFSAPVPREGVELLSSDAILPIVSAMRCGQSPDREEVSASTVQASADKATGPCLTTAAGKDGMDIDPVRNVPLVLHDYLRASRAVMRADPSALASLLSRLPTVRTVGQDVVHTAHSGALPSPGPAVVALGARAAPPVVALLSCLVALEQVCKLSFAGHSTTVALRSKLQTVRSLVRRHEDDGMSDYGVYSVELPPPSGHTVMSGDVTLVERASLSLTIPTPQGGEVAVGVRARKLAPASHTHMDDTAGPDDSEEACESLAALCERLQGWAYAAAADEPSVVDVGEPPAALVEHLAHHTLGALSTSSPALRSLVSCDTVKVASLAKDVERTRKALVLALDSACAFVEALQRCRLAASAQELLSDGPKGLLRGVAEPVSQLRAVAELFQELVANLSASEAVLFAPFWALGKNSAGSALSGPGAEQRDRAKALLVFAARNPSLFTSAADVAGTIAALGWLYDCLQSNLREGSPLHLICALVGAVRVVHTRPDGANAPAMTQDLLASDFNRQYCAGLGPPTSQHTVMLLREGSEDCLRGALLAAEMPHDAACAWADLSAQARAASSSLAASMSTCMAEARLVQLFATGGAHIPHDVADRNSDALACAISTVTSLADWTFVLSHVTAWKAALHSLSASVVCVSSSAAGVPMQEVDAPAGVPDRAPGEKAVTARRLPPPGMAAEIWDALPDEMLEVFEQHVADHIAADPNAGQSAGMNTAGGEGEEEEEDEFLDFEEVEHCGCDDEMVADGGLARTGTDEERAVDSDATELGTPAAPYVPAPRIIPKPAAWTLESGVTMDFLATLEENGMATIISTLREYGWSVMTIAPRVGAAAGSAPHPAQAAEPSVVRHAGVAATGGASGAPTEASVGSGAHGSSMAAAMSGQLAVAPSPRLARERPRPQEMTEQAISHLSVSAAQRISQFAGGRVAVDMAQALGRQLTQAVMDAAGFAQPSGPAQPPSATRGTAGMLAETLRSSTLAGPSAGIQLQRAIAGSDAAWQPNQSSAQEDRLWRLPGGRRSDIARLLSSTGLRPDNAQSSETSDMVRRYTQSDITTVTAAREGINPAAGTVVIGAKLTRRPNEGGNSQVAAFLQFEPAGAQFTELFNRGTPDEIDGAVLQRTAVWHAHGLVSYRAWLALMGRLGVAPCHVQPGVPSLVLRMTAAADGSGLQEEDVMMLDSQVNLKATGKATAVKVVEYLFREVALGSMSSDNIRALLRVFFSGYPLATGTLTNFCRTLCSNSGTRRLLVDTLIDILSDKQERHAYSASNRSSQLTAFGEQDALGFHRLPSQRGAGGRDAPADALPGTLHMPAQVSKCGVNPMGNSRPASRASGGPWPPVQTIARVFNILGSLLGKDPRVTAYLLGGDAVDDAALGLSSGRAEAPQAVGQGATELAASGKRARDDSASREGGRPGKRASLLSASVEPPPGDEEEATRAAGGTADHVPLRCSARQQDSLPIQRLLAVLDQPVYRTDVASLAAHVTVVYGTLRSLEPLAAVHSEAVSAKAKDALQVQALKVLLSLPVFQSPLLAVGTPELGHLQGVLHEFAIRSRPIPADTIPALAAISDALTEQGWPEVVDALVVQLATRCHFEDKGGEWAPLAAMCPPIALPAAGAFLQVDMDNSGECPVLTALMTTQTGTKEKPKLALEGCRLTEGQFVRFATALCDSSRRAAAGLRAAATPTTHTLAMRHWNTLCGTVVLFAKGYASVVSHTSGRKVAPMEPSLVACINKLLSHMRLFKDGPRVRPLGLAADLYLWPRDLPHVAEHLAPCVVPELASDAIEAAVEFLEYVEFSTGDEEDVSAVTRILGCLPEHMLEAAQTRPFQNIVPGWDVPDTFLKEHYRSVAVRRDTGEVRLFWEPVMGYTCMACEEAYNKAMGAATFTTQELLERDLDAKAGLISDVPAGSEGGSPRPTACAADVYGFEPTRRMRFARGEYVRHTCRFHEASKNVDCMVCMASPLCQPGVRSSNFTGHIMLRHYWSYTARGWETGSDVLEIDEQARSSPFESEEATYQMSVEQEGGGVPSWNPMDACAARAGDLDTIASVGTLAPVVAADRAQEQTSALGLVSASGLLISCEAGPPSAPLSAFGWHRLPDSFVERPHFVAFPAPVLSAALLRTVCRVLAYNSCTPVVAARVDATLRLLAALPGNRGRIREQMQHVAGEMATSCAASLANVRRKVVALQSEEDEEMAGQLGGGRSNAAPVHRPAMPASSSKPPVGREALSLSSLSALYAPNLDDEKLLRLVRTLKAVAPRPVLSACNSLTGVMETLYDPDALDAPATRGGDAMEEDAGPSVSCPESAFGQLWSSLDGALSAIVRAEGLRDTDRPQEEPAVPLPAPLPLGAAPALGSASSQRLAAARLPALAPALVPAPAQGGSGTGAAAVPAPLGRASHLGLQDAVSPRMQLVLARFTPLILSFFVEHRLPVDVDAVGTALDVEWWMTGGAHAKRKRPEPARLVKTLAIDSAFVSSLTAAVAGPVRLPDTYRASAQGVRSVEVVGGPASSVARNVEEHVDRTATREALQFVEDHKEVVNALVRMEASLLTGQFSFLVSVRDARAHLNFTNKRTYFRGALKAFYGSARNEVVPLHVDRKDVLQQSHAAMMKLTAEQLRGKLELHYKHEPGIDAGGLTKDWYEILARDMFNADYGLFQLSEDGSTYQPHHLSQLNVPLHLSWFQFVGRVVGKAIADGYLLDAHFARSMYKHMLGIPVTYHDMESLDADMHKRLMQLLASPLEAQGLTDTFWFTVTQESSIGGSPEDVPLVPSGEDIVVTDDNKEAYVALVTERRMTGSIVAQINAFLKGLAELVPPSLLTLFTPDELELLISGLPDIDVGDLKANTEYVGWRPTDEVVTWFWEAVESFDAADKARLLMFVTGTSKVPLGGFKALRSQRGAQRFSIQKTSKGDASLPVSHTCFNTLDLPTYSNGDTLRDKLLVAIREGGEGFGIA